MASNNSISKFTSTMSGIFAMVIGSAVNTTADKTCKASFLAPCGVILPLSALPPMTSNELIVLFQNLIKNVF